MAISPKIIQELREKTGVGMMDCKRALEEAGGDMEEAVKVLRKKGIATAEKKSVRAASEGLVKAFIAEDGRTGSLIEVNCETDFVARTDAFVALVENLSRQVAETAPVTVDAMLPAPYGGDPALTVKDAVIQTVAKLGENIQFSRFVRFEGDLVGSYIHAGGKIGVMMQCAASDIDDDVREVLKELCMQVAAAAPRFVSRDEVTPEVLQSERDIYRTQVLSQGKPENIVDKIVDGKMNKYYEENCLLEQGFIKDPSVKVAAHIKAKVGDRLKPGRFVRFVLGENMASSSCGGE
jgi:elongation factor Ts